MAFFKNVKVMINTKGWIIQMKTTVMKQNEQWTHTNYYFALKIISETTREI